MIRVFIWFMALSSQLITGRSLQPVKGATQMSSATLQTLYVTRWPLLSVCDKLTVYLSIWRRTLTCRSRRSSHNIAVTSRSAVGVLQERGETQGEVAWRGAQSTRQGGRRVRRAVVDGSAERRDDDQHGQSLDHAHWHQPHQAAHALQ